MGTPCVTPCTGSGAQRAWEQAGFPGQGLLTSRRKPCPWKTYMCNDIFKSTSRRECGPRSCVLNHIQNLCIGSFPKSLRRWERSSVVQCLSSMTQPPDTHTPKSSRPLSTSEFCVPTFSPSPPSTMAARNLHCPQDTQGGMKLPSFTQECLKRLSRASAFICFDIKF